MIIVVDLDNTLADELGADLKKAARRFWLF